jgi:hypothetical protein
VLSCIDPSVRIVTKSLKVGPLLIFSISLDPNKRKAKIRRASFYIYIPFTDSQELFRLVQGGSGWFRVAQGGSGWFRVIQGGSGCFRVVQGGSGWLRVVQGASG